MHLGMGLLGDANLERTEFSKAELQKLWEIANACLTVTTIESFQAILCNIVEWVPTVQGVVAGLGDRRAAKIGTTRPVVRAVPLNCS